MYLKRDIEDDILKWYNSKSKKVLRIDGARQVGKTSTILDFIEKHYTHRILLNLSEGNYHWLLEILSKARDDMARIDPIKFTRLVHERSGLTFVNDKSTIIFIDEVQIDHRIYNYLRLLNRNLKCDIIISGSYLNRALEPKYFQPAGDITSLSMYSLSFCEFLRVVDENVYNDVMKWPSIELDDKRLEDVKRLFSVYIRIGGYPEAVTAFLENDYEYAATYPVIARAFNTTLDESTIKLEASNERRTFINIANRLIAIMSTNKRGKIDLIETITREIECKSDGKISKKECSMVLAWFRECHLIGSVPKYVLPDIVNDYTGEKTYFLDVGMLAFFNDNSYIEASEIKGLLAETFVYRAMIEADYPNKFTGIDPHFGVYGDGEIDFFAKCKSDNLKYAFEVKHGNQGGKTATRLLKDKIADKVVYFMGDHKHTINDDVEIVPLCLAERWFSNVKYKDYGAADPSLFKCNLF